MHDVVIWGEVLFCIDFCMDFCALYFCAKLLGWCVSLKRILLDSLLCAVIGVICAANQRTLLTVVLSCIALGAAIVLIVPKAYRRFTSVISAICLFFFLEACTGGIMTAAFYWLNDRFYTLGFTVSDTNSRSRLFFLCAALILFILGIVNRILTDADVRKLVQRGGEAVIRIRERESVVPCIFDSGNLVCEPISGKSVVFVPSNLLEPLGIQKPMLENGEILGSRLIPIRTLDHSSYQFGIRPDSFHLIADGVDVERADIYLVFSDHVTHAIVPTTLLQHTNGKRAKRKDVPHDSHATQQIGQWKRADFTANHS